MLSLLVSAFAAVVAEADDPSLLARVAAQVNRYSFYRCTYPPEAHNGDGYRSLIAVGPDADADAESEPALDSAANPTGPVRLRVVVMLAVDSYM